MDDLKTAKECLLGGAVTSGITGGAFIPFSAIMGSAGGVAAGYFLSFLAIKDGVKSLKAAGLSTTMQVDAQTANMSDTQNTGLRNLTQSQNNQQNRTSESSSSDKQNDRNSHWPGLYNLTHSGPHRTAKNYTNTDLVA
jgi:hypothetical protein